MYARALYVTEQSLARMSSLTAGFMSMQSLQENYKNSFSGGTIDTALRKLLFTLQFNIHDKATDYHINSDSRYRYGKGNYGTGYNVQFRQELSCRGLVPYFQTGRIQSGTV